MHWQGIKLQLVIIPLYAALMMMAVPQIETSSPSNKRVGSVNMQMVRQNRHRSTFSSGSRTAGLFCADPSPSIRDQCEHYEQEILATVVRLEVRSPSLENPGMLTESGGHGTIKNGRFVVVHNHFTIDLSIFADEAQRKASLNLYSAKGYMLLRDARPPLFEIVVEDQETLVLDFGTNDEGEGFFDWFREPSAKFRNSDEITILPGSEVAQVNWDGKSTYIEWVQVQNVITHHGVPVLILANPLNQGSSGGGVFWNGDHIANNWLTGGYIGEGGLEENRYSFAALNSVTVAPNQLTSSVNLRFH